MAVSEVQKNFWDQVNRIMVEQGMQRVELARRLDLSSSRVTQLLSHDHDLRLGTVVRIAQALGCNVEIVLTRK